MSDLEVRFKIVGDRSKGLVQHPYVAHVVMEAVEHMPEQRGQGYFASAQDMVVGSFLIDSLSQYGSTMQEARTQAFYALFRRLNKAT